MTNDGYAWVPLTPEDQHQIRRLLHYSEREPGYEELAAALVRFQMPVLALQALIINGGVRDTVTQLCRAPEVPPDLVAEVARRLMTADDAGAWIVFADLMGTRLVPVPKMRRWLRVVRSLREIERFYEDRVALDVVVAVQRQFPDAVPLLIETLRATRQHGLTDTDAVGWLSTSVIRPDAAVFSDIVDSAALQFWQDVLPERAVLWAAAGFGVHEAVRADADGRFDEQMLLTMAAMR